MAQPQVLSTSNEQFWVVLFGVFVFANAADFITTKASLDLAGYHVEANPLLRVVMLSFGVNALLAMKTAACGVVWLLRRRIRNRTLLIANIAFSALAVNNAIQIERLT